MRLSTITPASALAITRAAAKAWCRIDINDDDDLIDDLIKTATAEVENRTWSTIAPATLLLSMPTFPRVDCRVPASLNRPVYGREVPSNTRRAERFYIPRGPVIAVSSFQYVDTAGTVQTLSAGSGYQMVQGDQECVFAPPAGGTWPDTQDGCLNGVRLQFTAGFATPEAVPPPIKQAILLLVAHWYDNRGVLSPTTVAEPQAFAVKALCRNSSWMRFDMPR